MTAADTALHDAEKEYELEILSLKKIVYNYQVKVADFANEHRYDVTEYDNLVL